MVRLFALLALLGGSLITAVPSQALPGEKIETDRALLDLNLRVAQEIYSAVQTETCTDILIEGQLRSIARQDVATIKAQVAEIRKSVPSESVLQALVERSELEQWNLRHLLALCE